MSKLTASQQATLTAFTSGADILEQAIMQLSGNELDYSCEPGAWTIRQIVHHVADDGDAWAMPFKKALATPGVPVRFENFPGNEAWADALAFEKRPIQTAVRLIKTHRELFKELAENFSDFWEQYVIIVDEQGQEVARVSVEQMLQMLSDHLTEHITTIEAITQQHKI